jgi:hypothetical protein
MLNRLFTTTTALRPRAITGYLLNNKVIGLRGLAAANMVKDPFKPAARVAGRRQDVW